MGIPDTVVLPFYLFLCCLVSDFISTQSQWIIFFDGHDANQRLENSYGHRIMKTRLPVRSAISKHVIARLVLQWVTMRESLVL